MDKYYKTGEFAKMANLSIRTIRYYDKIGLLKPSKIADNGYRMYSDRDFMKLQKILSLKYLGFSLDDIFSMTVNDSYLSLQQSLSLQKKMIDQKIEQLQNIKLSLEKTEQFITQSQNIDWKAILDNINFNTMEQDLLEQYKNSTNINIRIKLHEKYSINPIHWFEWMFSQYHLDNGMKVLEIGCGNGELWQRNQKNIPNIQLTLTDISQGMLDDAKNRLKDIKDIDYQCFDCHQIPYDNQTFDIVIANHVLFYVQDIEQVLKEINRVLKNDGIFYCSTYGKKHMKEITDLIKEFNPKITLSNIKLYDVFGLENGKIILEPYFKKIETLIHDDYLLVNDVNDIINYILSCHGNQSEFILKDYESFKRYMEKKVKNEIKITKAAGIFICRK
ncbi:MerR family transcriptional regulator [Longibaculum muris]|uniref:MerR-like DNA binding protein n=1 Tax=Longibaculum muris TaxID=1796628 RepID=A0A4R3ZBS2_9FIRM|nr:methyltransferase domain-containing protein [Longibaculum muris]MBS5370851.1 methyltransferase domain-containing protein [Coprobacillus cateniformis]MCR1886875.1 MerR family transcriptional regulator [Longibaculum muris]MED9812388.1 methyltransferase domain-containing protein [Longibaculum muris]TCW02906.1 MerR-like DNA binding protein [Longibaculum muris]